MAPNQIFSVATALLLFLVTARGGEVVFVSYNLENYFLKPHEQSKPKPESEIAAVVRIVKELNPDILGVCEMGLREDFEDFKKRLDEAGLGYKDFEYVQAADTERHVGLLSRLPISAHNSVTDAAFELNGRREKVKRGFLDVTIKVTEKSELRFIGAHLKSKRDAAAGEALIRRNEAHLMREHIDQIIAANPRAKLLAYGDCNDTKDQPAIHEITGRRNSKRYMAPLPLADSIGDVWTHYWKTADIYSRIDYIFANAAALPDIVAEKCFIHRAEKWNEASDHRPIVATIRVE